MTKFIGNCLICVCLLALAACASEAPKTTSNDSRKPTAKVRDLSNQPQGSTNNAMNRQPH
jgi:outer membrane biogenesis lipoprotein LolB